MGSHLASDDVGSHDMHGPGGDCARITKFCADCSYFCHPVFDTAAGYLIENQGRRALYSAPEDISEGVDPDVLPRPPKLG